MIKEIKQEFIQELSEFYKLENNLIQVIVGPRQVGKTTGVRLFLSDVKDANFHYVSADGAIAKSSSWILEQWLLAKDKCPTGYLVIDEIQKVENWSESIKKLWDEDKFQNKKKQLKVILLGSSSLSIQKGLSESLAGRYNLIKVWHWNHLDSEKAYSLKFEDYLVYGGYPGSYVFAQNKDQWLNYLRESIVEPVISKDILSLAHVKSPSLFKQCFDLACSYPAQEISYTKLLGQLQDKGNTDLVKHYLELLEGAFLIKQLFKYSAKVVKQRSSSPKLLPMCPALYSLTLDADFNEENRGRSFELFVGTQLLKKPGRLYYWREKNYEVDFVYVYGKKVIAIEVKSGRKKSAKGLEKFKERFPESELKLLTPENIKNFLANV